MNLPPYVFDVDHVAIIRSKLSITVLEKKLNKKNAQKSDLIASIQKKLSSPKL